MFRFGLPHLLLIFAAVIMAVGVSRLRSPFEDPRRRMRQALIVWLVLLASGVSVWLLARLQHL